METIRLVIPPVKPTPSAPPQACRSCGHWRLHRHGRVRRRVRDHQVDAVVAERYRYMACGRTFRPYPAGVTRQTQSQRTVVLATLLWGLGLLMRATAVILGAFEVSLKRDERMAGCAVGGDGAAPTTTSRDRMGAGGG